jgi:hypothetical protein
LQVYVVQTVVVFYREERQRRYIHAAFDRFLSPEIVRRIAADPGKPRARRRGARDERADVRHPRLLADFGSASRRAR